MNRRDLFKAFAGSAAAVGVTPDVLTAAEDPKRSLIVFRCSGRLSREGMQRIREQWTAITTGTVWADVPVLVVDDAISVECISAETGKKMPSAHRRDNQ